MKYAQILEKQVTPKQNKTQVQVVASRNSKGHRKRTKTRQGTRKLTPGKFSNHTLK